MTPYVLAFGAENSVVFEHHSKPEPCLLNLGKICSVLMLAESNDNAYQIAERLGRHKYPSKKGWRTHLESVCEIPDHILFSTHMSAGVMAATRMSRILDEQTPKIPFYCRKNSIIEAFVYDKPLDEARQLAHAHLEDRWPQTDGYQHFVLVAAVAPSYTLAAAKQNIIKRRKHGRVVESALNRSEEKIISLHGYR